MAGNDQEEQSDIVIETKSAIQFVDNVSNVSATAPGALIVPSADITDEIIQDIEQRMDENFTLEKGVSAERHSVVDNSTDKDVDALANAAHLTKSDDSVKESPFIEMSVDGIRRWLADWKARSNNGGTSEVVKGDDLDTTQEDLELKRSANSKAFLEIDSLLKAVSHDVNGLKRRLTKEYKCLEAFELGAEKLGTNEGTEACLNNGTKVLQNVRGFSDVITKQPENLDDLESTIKHLEEKLDQNEKDYLEAEAAMETRIKEYDREIADLHAQALQLDKEEQSMRTLIALTSQYLESQRHVDFSNDVAVVSIEDGCVELRVITYINGRDDQTDPVSQQSESFLEHNLLIKINQETMEIEEAKLIPDDVPMKDLLSVIQEKRDGVRLSESTQNGEQSKLGPQLLPLVTFIHDWQTAQAYQIASGRQRTAISNFADESQRKLEEHESQNTEGQNAL